jgi:hypothetical protein
VLQNFTRPLVQALACRLFACSPGFKTVEHVCVLGAGKAAWFKDTEGNYLRLHEDLA